MLYKNGQQIVVEKKFNSVDNPALFRNIQEKLEVRDVKHPFFKLEERARIKQ